MTRQFNLKIASAAIAGAFALMPLIGHAADTASKTGAEMNGHKTMPAANHSNASDHMVFSDRENFKPWSNEKDQLKAMLKPGQDKASYTKTLTDNGYQITSINADKPEYVEYEVVKGGNSYEVQLTFDNGSHMGKKVDIDSNLWRADATKAAMRGDKIESATSYVASNERFSDRSRMKGWNGEKDRLEKALPPGQGKAAYAAELKKLGYQITSTNENKKDYVEYEIVKGDNSYEVQIDLEAGKGKKVDVTSNMWQSEATEKALAMHTKK
ncbi:MAG: hypothetical protein ABI564_16010 [Ideonella sp.]